MFGLDMLDVAIGIIFVFLLVSLMCSALREALEAWLKTRAAYLERGIRELLHDPTAQKDGLASAFFNHPLIFSLFAESYKPGKHIGPPGALDNGRGLPSYIPAKNFAVALMDIAARGPVTDAVSGDPDAPTVSLESIRRNVRNVGNPHVQRVLLTAVDSAQGDLGRAQQAIEDWYNAGMDRVSGWYKRSTHWIIFWIGLAVAVGLNVDVISVARYLEHDKKARDMIVAVAGKAANDSNTLRIPFDSARRELDALKLPIGWPRLLPGTSTADTSPWYQQINAQAKLGWPLLGWFFTALAATMGAPFWFDVLNKVMVIRSTVKPHEKSPEESSEDRQTSKEKTSTGGGASAPTPSPQPTPHQPTPPPTPPQPLGALSLSVMAPTPRDAQSDEDACDVALTNAASHTPDDELPEARGGVDR